MAIRAYSEEYLSGAQNVLGHAVDFAVVTLGIEPDAFGGAFAVSEASKQFANGNPRYVAGMNGCELARLVLAETGWYPGNGMSASSKNRASGVQKEEVCQPT